MPTNNGNFSDIGSKAQDFVTAATLNAIEAKGIQFRLKCIELINSKAVSSSGALIDSISEPEITTKNGVVTMRISMADYYDYTNKGVKGWKSSKNAPNSPYQYKTKGMSDEGRKSVTRWVTSGKAKTVTFGKKTYGAQEKKQIKIESQVDGVIWAIKAYGLKKRSWFDDAVKEVFGDFEEVMAEAYGKDIAVSINLKGK